MSAQEQEATQEPTAPLEHEPSGAPLEEPTEPQEPAEDTEPVEEPEPIEGPDETAPAPDERLATPPEGMSEKDYEIRSQKLENENARHAKRVGEIMEEDATHLIGCPVCMDGIAGWIFPPEVQQLSDEAISRIRAVIGLPDYTNFQDAKDAFQCPDCGGLGKVKTGSAVPGREVKDCSLCLGAGWKQAGQTTNGTTLQQVELTAVTGPTIYGAGEPDDRIRSLREEGWFVAPPPNLPQT